MRSWRRRWRGRSDPVPKAVDILVVVSTRQPKAGVKGMLGAALKVAVTAPPEGGRANYELRKVLARAFELRRADVEIIAGHAARLKRVRLKGVEEARVRGVTGPG